MFFFFLGGGCHGGKLVGWCFHFFFSQLLTSIFGKALKPTSFVTVNAAQICILT